MELTGVASVIVAFIAAASAYAAQRSASKASSKQVEVHGRVDMEKEAYERARAFDTETIRRQDEELAELRQDKKDLLAEVKELRKQVHMQMLVISHQEQNPPTQGGSGPNG